MLCSASFSLSADDMATPNEAKAMSVKAAEAVATMDKDQAFALFERADGGFQDKDLYVFCMDMEGVMLAHARKPHLAGKNMLGFNEYGDYLFKDMVSVAASESGAGWVEYKWMYPGSEEIREKATYIIRNEAGFFCGVGAYK
jgi:methyl-accepting chemotaxis protein